MDSYIKCIKVLKKIKIKIRGGHNHRTTPYTISATYTIQYPPDKRGTSTEDSFLHHLWQSRTDRANHRQSAKKKYWKEPSHRGPTAVVGLLKHNAGGSVGHYLSWLLSCCWQFKNKFSLKQVAIKVKCTGELFIYLFYREEKQNRRVIYDRYRIGMWAPTFHAYNYWTQRQLTPIFSPPTALTFLIID